MTATRITGNDIDNNNNDSPCDDDPPKKARKRSKRDDDAVESPKPRSSDRKRRRQALLEQLATQVDNISQYNKQQLRRMCKRIERGLDPIETPKERHERLVQDAALRRVEEAELAGLVQANASGQQQDEEDAPAAMTTENLCSSESSGTHPGAQETPQQFATKKQRRGKPVPNDYVCFACQNSIQPPHWIYDCPQKETVRGTNQVCKKKRGMSDPSKNKLFLSGLPFDTTIPDLKQLVADKTSCAVEQCRLVTFPDSKRCKGQAYVSLRSVEEATKVRQALHGLTLPNGSNREGKKELQLRVTHVLNRFATKRKREA